MPFAAGGAALPFAAAIGDRHSQTRQDGAKETIGLTLRRCSRLQLLLLRVLLVAARVPAVLDVLLLLVGRSVPAVLGLLLFLILLLRGNGGRWRRLRLGGLLLRRLRRSRLRLGRRLGLLGLLAARTLALAVRDLLRSLVGLLLQTSDGDVAGGEEGLSTSFGGGALGFLLRREELALAFELLLLGLWPTETTRSA